MRNVGVGMTAKQTFVTELVYIASETAWEEWPTLPLLQGDEVVWARPWAMGKRRWMTALVKREIRV